MTTNEQIEQTKSKTEYTPLTDIVENKDSYTVVCEMPGVDENGVGVSLEKSVLTVTGEQHDLETKQLYYKEFTPGIYQRTFKIPDVINKDAISAKIKNGILTVVLPKAEKEKPKTIKVEAA